MPGVRARRTIHSFACTKPSSVLTPTRYGPAHVQMNLSTNKSGWTGGGKKKKPIQAQSYLPLCSSRTRSRQQQRGSDATSMGSTNIVHHSRHGSFQGQRKYFSLSLTVSHAGPNLKYMPIHTDTAICVWGRLKRIKRNMKKIHADASTIQVYICMYIHTCTAYTH